MFLVTLLYLAGGAVCFFLLKALNTSKANRWKQVFNPLVFMLIFVLTVILYNRLSWLVNKITEFILGYLPEINNLNLHFSYYLIIILSSILFALIKPIIHSIITKLRVPFIYERDTSNPDLIYLRDGFLLYRASARYIHFGLLAIILITAIIFYHIPNLSLPFIILVFLLFSESYWHINGNIRAVEDILEQDQDEESEEDLQNEADFEKVYSFFSTHQKVTEKEKIIRALKLRRLADDEKDETDKLDGNASKLADILRQNRDIIISTGNYGLIETELQKLFVQTVLGGGNVLVLGPLWNVSYKNLGEPQQAVENIYYQKLKQYLEKLLAGYERFDSLNDIAVFSSLYTEDTLKKSIILSSPFDILYHNSVIENNKDWFSNLELIIFENLSEHIVLNRLTRATLSNILSTKSPNAVFAFLSSEYQGLEAGIRSEYIREGNIPEVNAKGHCEKMTYMILWKNEGHALQRVLNEAFTGNPDHMGSIPVIAAYANKNGVSDYQWTTSFAEPDMDYIEEYETARRDDNIQIAIENQNLFQFNQNGEKQFQIVSDSFNNISYAIYRLRNKKNKKSFFNICSNPYLFRDYMAANMEYFSDHYLHPIAPKINAASIRNKLIILFECLKKYPLNEEAIQTILSGVNDNETQADIASRLNAYYYDHFGLDNFKSSLLQVQHKKDPLAQWDPISYYQISPGKEVFLSEYLKFYEIKEEQGLEHNSFGRIQKDLAAQFFLRKPFHVFHQKNFIIKEVRGEPWHEIIMQHHQEQIEEKWFASRCTHKIKFNSIESIPECTIENRIQKKFGIVHCNYSVQTTGRYDFRGNAAFDFAQAQYKHPSHLAPALLLTERTYQNKAALYFGVNIATIFKNIGKEAFKKLQSDIGRTLSFLIQESLLTFFPDTAEYLHCCCLNHNHSSPDEFILLPESGLESETGLNPDDDYIHILLIEDAQSDLGLIHSLCEQFHSRVLQYIDDFLQWHIFYFEDTNGSGNHVQEGQQNALIVEVEDGTLIEGPGTRAYDFTHAKPFLKCIDGEYPSFFDLKSTKLLLSKLFPSNSISEERYNYVNREELHIEGSSNEEQLDHFCDYCNSRNKSSNIFVIREDGRELCQACKETVIDEKQEVMQIIASAVKPFFSKFNQAMQEYQLKVKYCNTNEIQERMGGIFRPTRFYDIRALGIASFIGNEYEISIENMMPKKPMIMTSIHEWVHIWQYQNLNYEKMKADYDKYLIEGHATWAEIFYAQYIAKWPENWADILAPIHRRDEYGDGYRLIKKLMKSERPEAEDAFKYLLNKYPK